MLGFGNPSGHMTSNTFMLLSLYLHCYYEIGIKPKKMSVFCTAYIVKMALTVVITVYIILMGVSRVYLGAHSWNEVFFGFTLGMTFAGIGHYSVKPWFYALWDGCLRSEQSAYQMRVTDFVQFWASLFIGLCLSLAIFAWRSPDSEQYLNDLDWRNRMIASGCDEAILTKSGDVLHQKHFNALKFLLTPAGAFIGQYCEWRFLVNKSKLNSSPWLWHTSTLVQALTRSLITVAFLVLLFSPLLLLPAYDMSLYGDLALFMSAFLGSFLLRYLFHVLKLDSAQGRDKEFLTRA